MTAKKEAPKRNVTVRFSEDEIKWLQSTAEKEVRTLAQLVRWCVAEYRKANTK